MTSTFIEEAKRFLARNPDNRAYYEYMLETYDLETATKYLKVCMFPKTSGPPRDKHPKAQAVEADYRKLIAAIMTQGEMTTAQIAKLFGDEVERTSARLKSWYESGRISKRQIRAYKNVWGLPV